MAQTQKVTIQLGFKSDTTQVKKNLSELSKTLHQISNMEIGLKGGDLDQARNAARQLTVELQNAVNVDTGKLELNKLTTSLRKSKTDLVTLSSQLLQAGPIGQQSFLQIARAVSSAEVPTLKLSKSVKDFIDNLGNSMKWQIAQNAVHGLQSVLQGAVREAEQLNKALNDIRIVTGYDSIAMAQFAKQANRAAKELRTTTKEYAEASLIFYQQGLTGSEATKRAETVIKLAQVTNESAKSVSDQMTAIWNNFDDGTKSLEYYADAMAKLGADTAASTSEIATGLEKFAAIAETVGLSYETAMASVATVIDKTRQSSDVVGTAFKTIFARVQGLSLDGVTDDGVSLNKYSKALETVGVDVLTASGELRDMDAILEDLGSKWEGLGRETQVAVAQTVGGARQYNQILSLMDNWTEVQENINKASNATGELQNQADIWAEGYEAASERVKEASARAYENFLNSDQIVTLTNVLADIIEAVDKFIDRMNGIGPILFTITALFSKKLLPVIKTGFTALKDNLFTMFGGSERLIQKTQSQMTDYLKTLEDSGVEESLSKQYELTRKLILIKENMAQVTKNMSEQERQSALAVLEIYEQNNRAAQEAFQRVRTSEEALKSVFYDLNTGEIKTKARETYFSDKGIEDEQEQQELIRMSQTPEKFEEEYTENKKTYERYQEVDSEMAEIDSKIEGATYEDDGGYSVSRLHPSQLADLEKRYAELEEEKALLETKIQDNGISEEKLTKQQMALELRERTSLDVDHKYARAAYTSFGRQKIDLESGLEGSPEEAREQAKKISENIFEDTTIGDYSVSFQKVNDELEISLNNYEALMRKAAEYNMQLTRMSNIMEEIGTIDIEEEERLKEDKENQEVEIDDLESKIKTGDIEDEEEAIKQLNEAKEKLRKTEEQLGKVTKKNQQSSKQATRIIKANKDDFLKLAKQVGYTEDQYKELEKAIDALDENDPAGVAKFQQQFRGLTEAVDVTQGSLRDMANEMYNALQGKVDPQKLEQLRTLLQGFEKDLIDAAKASDKLAASEENFNNIDTTTKFETIATSVMQAAGAMMGLYNGVQSLTSAFTESTSAGEFFTNFLGGLMTMIPAVIGVFELFGKAKEKLAERTVRANNKQQISEVTESAVNVTGEMAEGVAEINPPKIAAAAIGLGIIGALGIGGAILAGVGGAIGKGNAEKQHEQDTATIEATEKSNELATASIKESNAIDDLTLEYNKLAEAKMDTAEITEDIIDQLNTVVKSYQDYRKEVEMAADAETKLANIEKDIESKTLELEAAFTTEERTAILADINKQRREADKLIAEAAIEQSNYGQDAVLREIRYKESQGDFTDTRMVKGHVERQAGHAGDTEIGDYLEDNYPSIVDVVHGGFLGIGDTVYFKIDTSSPENFIADYEELKKAVAGMANDENIGISNDVYREANELLTELTPSYEQLSTFVESEEAQQIVLNASKLGTGEITGAFGSVAKPEDIKNYQDYKQYISNVAGTNDVNSEEYIASKQYVDSLEGMSQYAQLSSKIRGVVGETDKDGNYKVTNKELKDYLENLNPEDYEFFLRVNTNIFDTEEEIEKQIPIIKQRIENENIQLKIKGVYEIADKIKPEGMTAEDWATIGENEVFAGNSEAFKEFLGKSYAEQLAYLYGQTSGYEKDLFKGWAEEEVKIKDAMNSLMVKNNTNDWELVKNTEEGKALDQQLEALEMEKLIWEAINRESVKYIKNLKKSDIFDIYHDLNNELDKLKNQYEELQETINNTFGIQQLNAYKDMIVNLQAQQKKLKEFAEVDKAEIGLEKNILSKQIKELLGDNLNTTIEFDEEGRISNYTEFFTEYYDYLDTLEKSGQSYDEAVRSQIEELISNYQGLWKTYDDRQQSIKETENKEKTTRYQEINQRLELKLDLDSIEMKEVEYHFEKLSKTISTVADAVKLFGDKMANIEDSLGYYDSYVDALNADMAASKITQSDYVEGLKKAHDAIYDQLQAMESLKEEIINYYGEILQKAQEEIDKYADRIEHATSVLNHYKTILELTGKATSTQTRTVLEGITAVAKSNLDVARKEYEFYNQQAIQTKAALEAYVAEHGDSLDKDQDFEYQILEKQWLDATEAMGNAQEEMLSKTAEWGEAMRAEVEYDMQELAKSLEKAFTGGVSFDELTASMERASLLQEDYLTTTNKIYETTKLMRTAQNAIDASTNNIAKQKLKGFVEETKQLQSQGKLSSVELDIQQKKYDLLVAEIALQDAQNAKSTVRLTRTADGGFGYVYTADENKIGEAQQQYEDADNALYNARLEAANSYAEKSIQTQQEFTQAMAELDQQRLDGTITSEEEFQRRRDELVAFYTQRLKDFSTIYSVAIQGDSRITQEAWSTDFANMVTDTDNWQNAVSNYIDAADARFREWEAVVDEIEQSTGIDLNSMAGNVGKVTGEAKGLADQLSKDGGTIDQVQGLIDKAQIFITQQADTWAEKVSALTGKYEDLAKQIKEAIKAQSELEGPKGPGSENIDPFAEKNAIIQKWKDIGKLASEGKAEEAISMYENWAYGQAQGKNYQGQLKTAINFAATNQSAKDLFTQLSSSGEQISLGTLYDTNRKIEKEKKEENILNNSIGQKIVSQNHSTIPIYECTDEGVKPITGLQHYRGSGNGAGGKKILDVKKINNEFYFKIAENMEYKTDGGNTEYQDYWVKYSDITLPEGFDTGGYTGSWGPEGKLAMLHQKEIILNADDTANFLASLDLLHSILKTIDIQAANAQFSSNLTSSYFTPTTSEILEQNVHIEASFPGVSDHNEVELALNNIINQASQYANRK